MGIEFKVTFQVQTATDWANKRLVACGGRGEVRGQLGGGGGQLCRVGMVRVVSYRSDGGVMGVDLPPD